MTALPFLTGEGMDTTTALISVALIAWVLQTLMGYFQVRSFNRMLMDVSLKGTVKIGKTSSRWKRRTLLVFVHDTTGRIVDARLMQGRSVFCRPQLFPELIDQIVPLNPSSMTSLNADVREALICAQSTK